MAARTFSLRAACVLLAVLAGGWGLPAPKKAADEGLAKPDFRAVYRAEFDKVYRLEAGEVLKRVHALEFRLIRLARIRRGLRDGRISDDQRDYQDERRELDASKHVPLPFPLPPLRAMTPNPR